MPARAAEPVSVLVLEQEDPDRPAYGMFMSGFRQELASRISERVNVYSERLFWISPGSTHQPTGTEFKGWLRTKHNGMVGGSCISFAELGREVADQTATVIGAGGTTSCSDDPDWGSIGRFLIGARCSGTA